MIKQLRTTFETFPDRQTGKNTIYTMTDTGLSAFLDFQRTMQETQGKNNAQTLFDVFKIPTDNHIRSLLDPVEPATVYPMFDFIFDGFQRAGVVDSFRSTDRRLLLALDGTHCFSSQKLHGSCCSCKTHSNGKVTYSHTVVTPVLVKPGSDKVISSAPEFVCPQDGMKNRIAKSMLRYVGWKGKVAGLRRWVRRYSVTIFTVTSPFAGRCWTNVLN